MKEKLDTMKNFVLLNVESIEVDHCKKCKKLITDYVTKIDVNKPNSSETCAIITLYATIFRLVESSEINSLLLMDISDIVSELSIPQYLESMFDKNIALLAEAIGVSKQFKLATLEAILKT